MPEGQWQPQDKALVYGSAAKKWTLDYAGDKTGEAKPVTALLKEVKRRRGGQEQNKANAAEAHP